MRLFQIKENASAGATSAGAICTNLAGGTPPKGQFFGGNPASSIYPTIKRNRKARKEKVAEETSSKVKNWVIKNEKTGKFWSSQIIGGWTEQKNAEKYSSDALSVELPHNGKWVNIDKVSEAAKTAKPPKKPSGKSEIIGSSKPYKQPNVLGPNTKVKSTGKILGGKPKKNPTLSTKFFGTCSATNDPGNKSIIAELKYTEFRNAVNAQSMTCPSCGGSFKNIHDANQKFCSKGCEIKGGVSLKLKEAWDRPMQTEFETKDGKIIDMETVAALVKRVMDDSGGQMGRLQACLFVSGMLKNCTGWTVLFALEDSAKLKAEKMYGKE